MKSLCVLCLVLLVAASGCVGAQINTDKVTDADLLEYGLCSINVKDTTALETTATGKYNVAKGTTFYKKTTKIPALLGSTFGIKYVVNGEPEGKEVNLKLKVTHPPIKGKTLSKATVIARLGIWRADFYTFDEPYELVTGNWTFQIYYEDKLLIDKQFLIFKE